MIAKMITEHISVIESLYTMQDKIEKLANMIINAIKIGKKVLIMGNGGSAADSQHFAAELVGRYKIERNAYPAIALTTDTSIITAIGNDYSYDRIFSRQIEALVEEQDIVIGITTSGNSKNIIKAFESAKIQGAFTVGLLGCDGGNLEGLADISLIVNSTNTPRIQESHILIIHAVCELIENGLLNV